MQITGEQPCLSKRRVTHSRHFNTYYNTGTIFYITFSPSPTEVTMRKYLRPPSPPSRNGHAFQQQFQWTMTSKLLHWMFFSSFKSTQREPQAPSVLAWLVITDRSPWRQKQMSTIQHIWWYVMHTVYSINLVQTLCSYSNGTCKVTWSVTLL